MKQLIPQNDMVLCTCLSSSEKKTKSGFVYKSNDIPLYSIEKVGPNVKMDLNAGDVIVVNSTGTLAILDNVEHFLFKEENVVGKVS